MTASHHKDVVDLAGSTVALFGMEPRGRQIACGAVRKGVALLDHADELEKLAAQPGNGTSRHLQSIIIAACPGDDLSPVPAIYNRAIELHKLVTVIVINRSEHADVEQPGSAGILQGASDIIVITPDQTCLDHMLELAVA
jgi:hypothetical protein